MNEVNISKKDVLDVIQNEIDIINAAITCLPYKVRHTALDAKLDEATTIYDLIDQKQ